MNQITVAAMAKASDAPRQKATCRFNFIISSVMVRLQKGTDRASNRPESAPWATPAVPWSRQALVYEHLPDVTLVYEDACQRAAIAIRHPATIAATKGDHSAAEYYPKPVPRYKALPALRRTFGMADLWRVDVMDADNLAHDLYRIAIDDPQRLAGGARGREAENGRYGEFQYP
jgi:hypothetical protein